MREGMKEGEEEGWREQECERGKGTRGKRRRGKGSRGIKEEVGAKEG